MVNTVNTLLSLVRDIERDMEQLQERRRPRAKSKLDILTDTVIEFEAGGILFSENAKNSSFQLEKCGFF